MKKLLMCVLILGTIRLTAQEQKEVEVIPVLQEWYTLDAGLASTVPSYLPNFDSLSGGLHAIVQGRGNEAPTWYNRFPYDTTNHFTWIEGSGNYIVYGDFNGDGIRDYWGATDRVFRGIKNGSFPNPKPDTNYYTEGLGYRFVADYNGDGYDDMLQQWSGAPCTNCHLFRIVWGGKDLKKLKQSTVGNFSDMNFGKMIGVYQNENKQWRIMSFHENSGQEAFYLYELGITNAGEIPTVEIKELDVVRKFKTDINEKVYIPNSCVVTNTYKQYAALLVATKDNFESDIYNVVNDKFVFLYTEKQKFGTPFFLKYSLNDDETPDYIRAQNGTMYLFNGVPQANSKPVAVVPVKASCVFFSIESINDVNNDSIRDIVIGGGGGCFSIVLGNKTLSSNNSVSDQHYFRLSQNEPNPVGKERKTLLPLSLNKSGNYTLQLYDIKGTKVQTLFEGFLNEGETKLPLDLHGLLAGMYIVRMSNGKQTRERAIMIGE